jgi:phosphohistidine phosphatase
MKTVLVLRHGKSDWQAGYGSDHDRPLAKRGIVAADIMGRFLTRNKQEPAKIFSSTAVRARSTAELAMIAGHWECAVEYTEALYGASVPAVIDLLRMENDALSSLLLVGHQPTWSELIQDLTGGASVRFPTAALARIDFEIDRWRDVESGIGALRWLVTPKILEQSGIAS